VRLGGGMYINLRQVFSSSNLSSQLPKECGMPVLCVLAFLLRFQSAHSKIIIVLALAFFELAVIGCYLCNQKVLAILNCSSGLIFGNQHASNCF